MFSSSLPRPFSYQWRKFSLVSYYARPVGRSLGGFQSQTPTQLPLLGTCVSARTDCDGDWMEATAKIFSYQLQKSVTIE